MCNGIFHVLYSVFGRLHIIKFSASGKPLFTSYSYVYFNPHWRRVYCMLLMHLGVFI